MRLFWRVFAANAAVLVTATVVLAVSPATVSFPIGPVQAAVLALGLALMLGANLFLLRRAFSPFDRMVQLMRRVDPLRPGVRLAAGPGSPDLAEISTTFNEMLDRLETERRDSAGRQVMAQEHERRRVARELHDEVGQLLTVALLQIDNAARYAPAEVRAALDGVGRTLEETHRGVRAIARGLRPLTLDDLGLPRALGALAKSYERSGDFSIARDIDVAGFPDLTEAEELVLYRVAQEALTNVARHARATRAEVALHVRKEMVEMLVRDNGRGMTGDEAGGIRGMRERCVLIGARLDVSGRAAGGTEVRVRLPRNRS